MALSLIRGKHVVCKVTGRESADVVSDGAVVQRDGVIEAVGDYQELSARYPDAEVIGSGNHIVMPGLVNDHFHVGLTPFQMGAPDLPLEMWSLQPHRRADAIDPVPGPALRRGSDDRDRHDHGAGDPLAGAGLRAGEHGESRIRSLDAYQTSGNASLLRTVGGGSELDGGRPVGGGEADFRGADAAGTGGAVPIVHGAQATGRSDEIMPGAG